MPAVSHDRECGGKTTFVILIACFWDVQAAPVIVLDEATSNVDPENEKERMEAIGELTHNKTVIMIAHRLKTVRNADCIFVVDGGRIVRQGVHGELDRPGGHLPSFRGGAPSGVVAGFFVHTVLCIQPILYKGIMEEGRFELADAVLEKYYRAVIPPFVIGYLFMFASTVCAIIAILTGCIAVPKWFVLLNPFVFLFVGMGLRKWKLDVFFDLPGIILPSFGMGMFGLIGTWGLL